MKAALDKLSRRDRAFLLELADGAMEHGWQMVQGSGTAVQAAESRHARNMEHAAKLLLRLRKAARKARTPAA